MHHSNRSALDQVCAENATPRPPRLSRPRHRPVHHADLREVSNCALRRWPRRGQAVRLSRALTQAHGLVPVHDSKAPDGPALVFPAGGWTSFVSAVKRGQFSA
ncbi:DUF397 domain-containing protein [Streptomyces inhibens]|uniref:DUF397 domain-containing protein n=1 Tax=Streptomyces inhibens TaxID=2293571 RepID=A0A371Q8C4_STRIH|nr:DUF397 domain-containing protein [Streptomyces inhibens]